MATTIAGRRCRHRSHDRTWPPPPSPLATANPSPHLSLSSFISFSRSVPVFLSTNQAHPSLNLLSNLLNHTANEIVAKTTKVTKPCQPPLPQACELWIPLPLPLGSIATVIDRCCRMIFISILLSLSVSSTRLISFMLAIRSCHAHGKGTAITTGSHRNRAHPEARAYIYPCYYFKCTNLTSNHLD